MRTYSHTLLTHTAAHRLATSNSAVIWAAVGATIPDLPAIIGATWLFARNRVISREAFDSDVCARTVFRAPDAALHSIPLLLLALSFLAATKTRGAPLAFVLGCAGHVATDALTHGTDARPLFWPLSNHRFQSPISYRERDRHALVVTAVEHALILAALANHRYSS